MSICTRMTLAQFGRLATTEEDALPVDQVVLLLNDVAVRETRLDAVKARLATLLARRYGSAARHLRDLADERTGAVTVRDGDFIVTAVLPQEVTWDQKKLAKLAETIFHDWERDPEDYITISYTVEEKTYLGWPPELRERFDDARIVGVGKTSFDITGVRTANPKTRGGKVGGT